LEAKLVELKISFIFGRSLGAGTCPTKHKEIINDKQFTFINLAAPWGRVGGQELAQLKNKKFSIITGSLRPIWPPPRGGFWGGEVPNWKNVKMSIRIFHFD
jgi:hypothetical protein